jgi:hypothetical protein
MKLTTPHQTALAFNIMAMLGLPASEAFTIHPADDAFAPGRVLAYNAAQFGSNNPSEFLTNYALRYTDPLQDSLRAIREALAPEVRSNDSSYVQYPVYTLGDAFLTMDTAADARRAIGADYATLRNTAKTLTTQKLPDVGLAVEVDEEEELLDSDWQQRKVAWLLGILDRTELRTAIALFVAGAANTAKTWDTTAGKDPDQDVMTIIDSTTIRPSTILIGPGAWTKRALAHRAQNTAGGFSSASMTPEQLAGFYGVGDVIVPRNKYATSSSATGNVLGSYVLMFTAMKGMSRDDFSNLKTFTAPSKRGDRAVYVRQIGDKRWRIAVSTGKRLVALTSTAGAELITVS